MRLVKAIHRDDLDDIADEARKYQFNRYVDKSEFDPDVEWYPITFDMVHTRMRLPGDPDYDEPHKRLMVIVNREGGRQVIDMTLKRFNKLDTVGVTLPEFERDAT